MGNQSKIIPLVQKESGSVGDESDAGIWNFLISCLLSQKAAVVAVKIVFTILLFVFLLDLRSDIKDIKKDLDKTKNDIEELDKKLVSIDKTITEIGAVLKIKLGYEIKN